MSKQGTALLKIPSVSMRSSRHADDQHSTKSDSNYGTSSKRYSQEEMEQQVSVHKEKAHQSFMQVIQMQQLHDQELQLLRHEFEMKEQEMKLHYIELDRKYQKLQEENTVLGKNLKSKSRLEIDDCSLDSIDTIICKDGSFLDESCISNLKEFIGSGSGSEKNDEIVNAIKKELFKDILAINQKEENTAKIEKIVNKFMAYIFKFKQQIVLLYQKYAQCEKLVQQNEIKYKNNKNILQTLQKENKFMTEHIKRVSQQKLNFQRRIIELENALKFSQQKLRRPQQNKTKANDNASPKHYYSPRYSENTHDQFDSSYTSQLNATSKMNIDPECKQYGVKKLALKIFSKGPK